MQRHPRGGRRTLGGKAWLPHLRYSCDATPHPRRIASSIVLIECVLLRRSVLFVGVFHTQVCLSLCVTALWPVP